MKIKLAEALLRRKELNEKVQQLKAIQASGLFEVKVQRKAAHEGIDDIVASVPKLDASQVTKEYDFYARNLRLIDASIQRANWETDVEVQKTTMDDFREDS